LLFIKAVDHLNSNIANQQLTADHNNVLVALYLPTSQ